MFAFWGLSVVAACLVARLSAENTDGLSDKLNVEIRVQYQIESLREFCCISPYRWPIPFERNAVMRIFICHFSDYTRIIYAILHSLTLDWRRWQFLSQKFSSHFSLFIRN